jgi:hypothetical protein
MPLAAVAGVAFLHDQLEQPFASEVMSESPAFGLGDVHQRRVEGKGPGHAERNCVELSVERLFAAFPEEVSASRNAQWQQLLS